MREQANSERGAEACEQAKKLQGPRKLVAQSGKGGDEYDGEAGITKLSAFNWVAW